MKEFRGTKGKWEMSDDIDENMYIIDEVGNCIATVSDGDFDLNMIHMDIIKSNAQLIAAAPEMLDLLLRVKGSINRMDYASIEALYCDIEEITDKALGING